MSAPATGSVYLDAPRPARGGTGPGRSERVRLGAACLLGAIGLAGLSAATLFLAANVAFSDPEPVVQAFADSYDDPLARTEIETEIAEHIESELLGSDTVENAAAFGVDLPQRALDVAPAIVDDPGFRPAADELVAELHRRIVLTPDPTPVDTDRFTAITLAVIDRDSPDLAFFVRRDRPLLPIAGDSLSDLSGPMRQADRGVAMGGLLAIIALAAAAMVHPRRHRVVAWIGRWLLGAALAAAVLAVAAPFIGGYLTGFVTVEAAVRTDSFRLFVPAGVAAFTGLGIVTIAAVAKRRTDKRTIEEGAAAALGVNESSIFIPIDIPETPPSPVVDRSPTGLVDVAHPLTNS